MNDIAMMGRILVAEDDPLWRDLLKQVLSALHYDVVAVNDGEAAWAALTNGATIDLVITDRNMPNLNGMQLLERVQSDSGLRHIPVIFQSALDKECDVLEGLAAGVFYYLEKPYTLDRMRTVVAAAMADTQSRKQLGVELQRQRQALNLLLRGSFTCRTLEHARELAAMLASTCPQPDTVVNGLSELLINAIEHGNLGISYEDKGRLLHEGRWLDELEARLKQPEHAHKQVRVDYIKSPDCITIIIEDMGMGFDWLKYLELDPARVTHAHGRGIAMARLISFSSLEYQGSGNRVVATIDLTPVAPTSA